jgi:hypothetical protein
MRSLFAVLSVVASSFSTCEESLPPREEPNVYLEAEYSVSTGVVEIRDSAAVGLGGAFTVSVKNVYVEVLQENEFARAEIDVWLREMPEQRSKVIATRRELTDPSIVYGGLLTLRPNARATFLKQWDHKTLGGRHLWEFVRLTQKYTPRGEPYLESDPLRLAASGKVQLFQARGITKLPRIEFELIYRIF